MLSTSSTKLPLAHRALQTVLRPPTAPSSLSRRTSSFRASTGPRLPPASGSYCGQTRWIATPSTPRPTPKQFEARKPTVWQILRRSLNISDIFRGQSVKKVFQDSPEEFTLAVILLAATFCGVGYVVYMYFTYFYSEQFTQYPPDVAQSLRRALYYSNYQLDPQRAVKYYELALKQCHQNGLDPFSDKVSGIQIQIAMWLERIGHIKGAVEVLERVLVEYKKWMNFYETDPQKLPRAPIPGTVVEEGDARRTITQEDLDQWLCSSRNRVLAKICQMSVKLGELYGDDHILEIDKAHDNILYGVETALQELRRRASEGVKEGEGPWLNPDEIGAGLESLGHSFERKLQFDLALPLFFQALRLCKDECHMAVIMNNLAVCFAQHPPREPYNTLAGIVAGEEAQASPTEASQQVWTRKEFLESAQRWAKNALQHAKEPTGEKRTPECDQACAVALVNLGDIAAMSGDPTLARRSYEKAIQVSAENNYAEGAEQAQAGLKKLEK